MTDYDRIQDIIETIAVAIPRALANVLDSQAPENIIEDTQACLDSLWHDLHRIRDRAQNSRDSYVEAQCDFLLQRHAQTRSIATHLRGALRRAQETAAKTEAAHD